MTSPYSNLPTRSFWRPAVANRHIADFDEVAAGPFFRADDRIATAGSCFAQHLSRHLQRSGLTYFVAEEGPVDTRRVCAAVRS